MSTYQNRWKSCWFWDYLIPFTKFWGVFTSIVLCGVGADIFVHHHTTGIYIILATTGLFILEIAWVITLFLRVCIHDEYSNILYCWNGINWINKWRKTIIYAAFGFGLLFNPHNLWLSTVAGTMLIVLGLLHFLHCWEDTDRGYRKDLLLDNQDNYLDRFDICDDDGAVASKDKATGNILNNNEQNNKLEI